ncbi:MAG: SpoIIE family protein phosphatase [Rhodobacteraceae bacterium]|nr:SpoIIE family protein phosphatase [Paracoccaceae bacterium]
MQNAGIAQSVLSIERVLVVEDSALQRRVLVAYLQGWGFEVLEAADGASALEICRRAMPDLVISDWMMPGMDGLTFCGAFRALQPDRYGYFILLTAKSDKVEIARGLDAGADDFLIKPVNAGELRARIRAGDRILRMQRELSHQNRIVSDMLDKLQDAYNVIDGDLMQAKKIQESLVPDLVAEYGPSRVSLLLKPSGHVGGDLVGMFSPGPARVGFYNIDVSGHGITSAMMTARLGGYLSNTYFDQNVAVEKRFNRFYALRQPREVATLLNNRLVADAGVDQYFTMAYGIIDLNNGLTRIVQAGHPHPLLIRANGRCEFVGTGGMPIGLLPDAKFGQFTLHLAVGDRLLLYSDGFTECPLRGGGMLEEEGLLRLVQASSRATDGREFLDDLFWRLTEQMATEGGMQDDVSATLLEFNGF